MRDKVGDAEREGACAQLVAQWSRLEAEWVVGAKSNVTGSGRISLGGVGNGRVSGMTPEPVLRPTWQAVVNNHQNARGLPVENVGTRRTSVDRMRQRAKPPSASGRMVAFSSSTVEKLPAPAPVSLLQAEFLLESETSSVAFSEQIVHSDKVAWRYDARRVCWLCHLNGSFRRNVFAKSDSSDWPFAASVLRGFLCCGGGGGALGGLA